MDGEEFGRILLSAYGWSPQLASSPLLTNLSNVLAAEDFAENERLVLLIEK